LPGTLYVVATPIGNLRDITLRAVDTLKAVDGVVCEDTRVARKLLAHLGLSKPTRSCFSGNEAGRVDRLVSLILEGESLALTTDAGTPGISDPGYLLVRECRKAEIPVVPIPGPSALAAGLSVSGLPASRVLFLGFPPRRQGERTRLLESLFEDPSTLVFYESPRRVRKFLEEARRLLPGRETLVEREITKRFESTYSNPEPGDLPERGEFVLIFGPPRRGAAPAPGDPESLLAEVEARASDGLPEKEALREVAKSHGLKRRDLYQMIKRRGN